VQATDPATIVAPDGAITVNSAAFSSVESNGTENVIVKDTDGTLVGSKVGSEWIVPKGGASPSGVLFDIVTPTQRVSYRTGDEGWRVQNGWFDYTPPVSPLAIAELDYTSASFIFLLNNNLVVNGISSKTRFVDVDGGQTFSATGNKDKVLIDKLTGNMITRANDLGLNVLTDTIDGALSLSIVVDGVTYDDWYLMSLPEYIKTFGFGNTNGNLFTDSLTSVNLMAWNSNFMSTATTANSNTAQEYLFYNINNIGNPIIQSNKTTTRYSILVRKCHNLIS
jgi:hypothetical protein